MAETKSVLVVDDSRLTRMMIIKMIKTHHHDWPIREAATVSEALECVNSQSFHYISLLTLKVQKLAFETDLEDFH